jgi:hypothetical protein
VELRKRHREMGRTGSTSSKHRWGRERSNTLREAAIDQPVFFFFFFFFFFFSSSSSFFFFFLRTFYSEKSNIE